ncbi:MAG TPA: cytochrome P450 [Terracidiphilus sp.]|nr:cytochrome P450 [Terracidiphilus sp.]
MDPDFHPAPPGDALFDTERSAWIISRHAEVAAALRETALYQSSPTGEVFPTGEDETQRSQTFMQVRGELARISGGELRAQMQSAAQSVLGKAAAAGRVDLVGEIAHAWSIDLLLNLGGDTTRALSEIVTEISAALLYKSAREDRTDSARDRGSHPAGLDPEKQLDEFLERKQLAVSKSMFLAVSTTLPSFLGKSWLALLRNPEQAARLHAEPQLMHNTIEELLRYAGIVHTLYRKAMRDLQIGTASVSEGQMVHLKIASANFDPERFEDPYRLDIARRPCGQFALGAGLHACVGAALVREAFGVLTPHLLAARPALEPNQELIWRGNSTLKWPLSVFVRFG